MTASQPQRPKKGKFPFLPLIDGNDTMAQLRRLKDQATLTMGYVERAIKFIEKNIERPFFLYVPPFHALRAVAVSEKLNIRNWFFGLLQILHNSP